MFQSGRKDYLGNLNKSSGNPGRVSLKSTNSPPNTSVPSHSDFFTAIHRTLGLGTSCIPLLRDNPVDGRRTELSHNLRLTHATIRRTAVACDCRGLDCPRDNLTDGRRMVLSRDAVESCRVLEKKGAVIRAGRACSARYLFFPGSELAGRESPGRRFFPKKRRALEGSAVLGSRKSGDEGYLRTFILCTP
jgi:hypothetical protein